MKTYQLAILLIGQIFCIAYMFAAGWPQSALAVGVSLLLADAFFRRLEDE